ncbi:glycosyltransferase family 2 protein [Arthrobacter sp. H-02-3]|uniref:glycosyltransferase family 2 protein n=1 Tax=Arthrobacter sp. H-02-3 TaxID=2703675 RepID=UPI000DD261EF|nr:glycosyltransferase family A protein [Arthrobacter sp. H-02-3]PVZ57063.1 glycosyl transferase [Arthrobacter sp. H-02-3]
MSATVAVDGLAKRIRTRPGGVPGDVATVTVVIPCYNYARYLPQAVRSAVSQTGAKVDVIIVDDASTDDSLTIAQQLSATHPNVSVLAHDTNRGMVETFNDGAKAARGEFLVRLDADDMLTPGSLARATMVARQFPSVGLIYGHPIHFDTSDVPPSRETATAWTVWPGREWLRDRCRSAVNVITSPEVVMRRSVVEEVGYQAPLRHTPDMEHWFRIAAFADVAYIHGADQAWHRDHADSMSAKEVDRLLDLQERREAFDVLFDGPAGKTADAVGFRRDATQALVHEALATAAHELDRGAGASKLYEGCLDLARDLDPSVAQRRVWGRLHRRAAAETAAPWTRAGALATRIVGRARSELRLWNWHRNGVF